MGAGIGKIVVLILAIAVVWFGFRWVQRYIAAKNAAQTAKPAEPKALEAEATVRCGRCGTFVPASGAKPCERADCAWSAPS
ncbi:MAG: hypothetical protein FJX67_01635 [Alphaproteobacteria bacterium]|nr:hypothetical protein [Alphaproteobacteria bacterium]